MVTRGFMPVLRPFDLAPQGVNRVSYPAMSLAKEIRIAVQTIEELRESLSPDEIAQLHQELDGTPFDDWWNWFRENRNEVALFAGSTAAVRAGRRWKTERKRLVLAGIQHCQLALGLLRQVHERRIEPNLHSRTVMSEAGLAAIELLSAGVGAWPFEDPWESPFR
jgi:hypothetical protein